MSRYKFKLQPQGAIPGDLSLKLQLRPVEKQSTPEVLPAEVQVVVDSCPEATFVAWGVSVILGNMDAFGVPIDEIVVREDNPSRQFPYPDGCFGIAIEFIGCLRADDVLALSFDDGGVGLPDLSLVQLTATRWELLHLYHFLSTPSIFDGTAITINATVNGNPFGVPIYLHCDPAAHTWTVVSWVTNLMNVNTQDWLAFNVTTFPALQPEAVNTIALNGYLWGANDLVSWTVTQLGGPAVTLPTIESYQCGIWYMQRADGESYAGCSFSVSGMIGAEPFGTPITFTCEV